MTPSFRRIVTGHDANGRSVVISDAPSENRNGSLINFWTTFETPAPIDAPDPMGKPITLHPTEGGVHFRYFQIPPESAFEGMSRDERYAMTRERFVEMGAEHALVDTTRHPAMHKTHTLDYIILLTGEVTLLLDEADVPMKPLDVVIQRGTNHAWLNTGTDTATLMAVLIDGKD